MTGFLGSGKTTLLNYILTQNHGKRIAVIENEFGTLQIFPLLLIEISRLASSLGEISIDDLLIKDKFNENEEIFLMNNGCICCTVRGDLIKTLGALMEQKDKVRGVVLS